MLIEWHSIFIIFLKLQYKWHLKICGNFTSYCMHCETIGTMLCSFPCLGGVWRSETWDQGPGGGDRAPQQPVTGCTAFEGHLRQPTGRGAGVSEECAWAEEPPSQGIDPPPQHVWCGLHRQCPPYVHLCPSQWKRHPNNSALPKCRGANEVDIVSVWRKKVHVINDLWSLTNWTTCFRLMYRNYVVTLFRRQPQ